MTGSECDFFNTFQAWAGLFMFSALVVGLIYTIIYWIAVSARSWRMQADLKKRLPDMPENMLRQLAADLVFRGNPERIKPVRKSGPFWVRLSAAYHDKWGRVIVGAGFLIALFSLLNKLPIGYEGGFVVAFITFFYVAFTCLDAICGVFLFDDDREESVL